MEPTHSTDDSPAPGRRPDVVVVGAGYAGVHAARTARDAGAHVTLVDPTGRHDLAPRLAAVAAGRRGIGDAWAAVDELLDVELRRDLVTEVDAATGEVHLAGGEVLRPRSVVVTAGASAWLPPVDGLDHATALTLKDASDALRVRTRLADADGLVVVGAGATGVQLAAEVAARHPIPVTLVEVGDRLLDAFPGSLGRRAGTLLRRRGVDVRLDTEVTRVDARGIELADGARLDGLVVWTTGVAADATELLPGCPTRDGRLLVDRCLRVGPRVLAAGDMAATRDVLGRVTAMSAQIALQSGRAAGRNAAAIAAGRAPSAVPLVDLGWIVDLGGRGVGQVGPLPLAAPIVDRAVPLLHELVDARHLLQFGGLRALVEHAPGRHRPDDASVRRAERPSMRAVG